MEVFQYGSIIQAAGSGPITIDDSPARPDGRYFFFGAHGFAAFFAAGAQGFAALFAFGAQGLAAFVAFGAQGFAACAVAGSDATATSAPSAAIELRARSEVLSAFIAILLSG